MATSVSINRLFFSLVTAYMALLVAGLLGFRWYVSYPDEIAGQLREQQQAIDSLNAAIILNQQQLVTQTRDYATWDDTWFYVQNRNQAYIDSNFVGDTFDSLNLIGAMIIDSRARNIISWHYDLETGELLQDALDTETEIALARSKQMLTDGGVYDVTLLGKQPALVGVSAITRSDGTQADKGWLFFWRPIDQAFLDNLSRITRLEIRPILHARRNLQNIAEPITDTAENHQLCMLDRLGRPEVCMDIRFPNYHPVQFMGTSTWIMLAILAVVPTLFFWLIMHLLIAPIRNATLFLESSVRTRSIRNLEVPEDGLQIREIRRLLTAYNQLASTVLEQKSALQQLTRTDALTGIANRRAFDHALERAWFRMNRYQQSMALVLIDIDHFKRFNDSAGHPAGDEVLRQVAEVLANMARRTDEVAARFGGEEFALIVYAHSTLEVESLRRNLHEAIANLAIRHPDSPTSEWITVSAGIAWIRNSGEWLSKTNQEDWLAYADMALYKGKANGRNNSVLTVFDQQHPLEPEATRQSVT